MKISGVYQKKDLTLSFEVFPPKGDLGADVLRDVLAEDVYKRQTYSRCQWRRGSTRSHSEHGS